MSLSLFLLSSLLLVLLLLSLFETPIAGASNPRASVWLQAYYASMQVRAHKGMQSSVRDAYDDPQDVDTSVAM